MKIDCNFKIPEGYTNKFYFKSEGVILEIIVGCQELHLIHFADAGHEHLSQQLDWIQEVLETIRAECENQNSH